MTSVMHTHYQTYNGQGPPTSECFSRLKTAYSARKEPLKGQRSLIYARLCQTGEKCPSQCQPRLFYSQPRQLPCAKHPVLQPGHLSFQNGLHQLDTTGVRNNQTLRETLQVSPLPLPKHGMGLTVTAQSQP